MQISKVRSKSGRFRELFFPVFIFFVFLVFRTPLPVYAQEHFKTDYFVDYYLTEESNNLASRVSFHIKITNLTPDLFIKNYSISFPKSFQIGNIKANDDFNAIIPQVTDENDKHKISVEMSNPQAGMNSENNIYLDFLQQNLFKVNGTVWEVILPTIDKSAEQGDYIITVHLPPNSNKRISIAKPKPDHITLGEIVWKNPANKTVYAVFGSVQNYSLQLRYNLNNPNLTRVYTDVAFPPDTLYQKITVNSIRPEPEMVYSDEDGNYIGRFYLNPKEEKTIYFNGGVSVFAAPRDEMKTPTRELFNSEKKFLLSAGKYWNLQDNQFPPNLKTVQDIYKYTINTLSYNYARLNSNITRLGSSDALKYPDQSVCTEYSDVFVSLSREKGIYSREIQGYGFSSDQELRPLSVNSDILHSWPEFYDVATQLWVPLDPTWEDTSGIDYFSSFDLNHIAFAIHGKKSDYPYPAGSYKISDNTKDINITPSSEFFTETKALSFEVSPLQLPAFDKNTFTLKVIVQNKGNSYIWDMPIEAVAKGLTITPSTRIITSLAPFEKKELLYEYSPESQFTNIKTKLVLTSNGKNVYEYQIAANSLYFTIIKNLFIGILIAFGLYIAIKLIKK